MDWKSRLKNPWFWIGLLGVILTAMGAEPSAFTSWGAVLDALKGLGGNPYMIFTVICAVLGVFVEPTTKGLLDKK